MLGWRSRDVGGSGSHLGDDLTSGGGRPGAGPSLSTFCALFLSELLRLQAPYNIANKAEIGRLKPSPSLTHVALCTCEGQALPKLPIAWGAFPDQGGATVLLQGSAQFHAPLPLLQPSDWAHGMSDHVGPCRPICQACRLPGNRRGHHRPRPLAVGHLVPKGPSSLPKQARLSSMGCCGDPGSSLPPLSAAPGFFLG